MKVTTYETHYMKNMVLLWSTIYETRYIMVLLWSTSVEKRILALPLFIYFLFFWAFFFFLWPFFFYSFWPFFSSLLFIFLFVKSEVSSRLVGNHCLIHPFLTWDNDLIIKIITLLFTYNSILQLDTRTKIWLYMNASGGVPECAMI